MPNGGRHFFMCLFTIYLYIFLVEIYLKPFAPLFLIGSPNSYCVVIVLYIFRMQVLYYKCVFAIIFSQYTGTEVLHFYKVQFIEVFKL